VSAVLVGPLVAIGIIGALIAAAARPSRIDIDVDDGALRIRIRGHDGILALCRELRVPLAKVEGVSVAPRRLVPATGLRFPGTSIPGVIRAGSYGSGGKRDFWLVRKAQQLLVFELAPGAAYRRIVLEVPDPHAEALRLRPSVGAFAGTFTDR
jgi:hypothetical protein